MSKRERQKQAEEAAKAREGLLVILLVVGFCVSITLGNAAGGTTGAWGGLLLFGGIWVGTVIALDLRKHLQAAAAAAEKAEKEAEKAEADAKKADAEPA